MIAPEPLRTRRGFLRGELTGRAEGGELVRWRRAAMGCRWEILLPAATGRTAAAVLAAFDLVERLESLLSVYRAGSELSRVNALAARAPVAVGAELFDVLRQAADLCVRTRGAFDPTAGPLVRAWGFPRRRGELPDTAAVEDALAVLGMERWVRLDATRRSVQFGRAGVELNLGAIGKGYAVDGVCKLLVAEGVRPALVHAGQSTAAVLGVPPWDDAWIAAIADPHSLGQSVARVRLRAGAMSTSAAVGQSFVVGGRRFGHILDPRTGMPAEGLASATVFAASAAEADALSTAFYVLGADGAARYCREHAGIGALLVCGGGGDGPYELLRLGSAQEDWEVVI